MSASESQEGVRGDHLYDWGKAVDWFLWGSSAYGVKAFGGGRVVVGGSVVRSAQNEPEWEAGSGFTLVLPLSHVTVGSFPHLNWIHDV